LESLSLEYNEDHLYLNWFPNQGYYFEKVTYYGKDINKRSPWQINLTNLLAQSKYGPANIVLRS